MVLLQHKLSLKVSQRQILTPGLVQMVSVLALNKLELRDMITAEMVENPVLEELEESVPLIDDVNRREEDRDRAPIEESPTAAADAETKDPFEEIDGACGGNFHEPRASGIAWLACDRPYALFDHGRYCGAQRAAVFRALQQGQDRGRA